MGAVKSVGEVVETYELRFASFPIANGCVDGAKRSRGDVESVKGCGDGGLAR